MKRLITTEQTFLDNPEAKAKILLAGLDASENIRHKSLEMLQVYYDRVKKEADLPKYYRAFGGVKF